jgi:hypothetical protein
LLLLLLLLLLSLCDWGAAHGARVSVAAVG